MSHLAGIDAVSLEHIVGWAMLHSLWQGTILAVSLAVCLRAFQGRSPGLRYWASGLTLAAFVLCPLLTALSLLRSFAPQNGPSRPWVYEATLWFSDPETGIPAWQKTLAAIDHALPILLLLWLAGVCLLLMRLVAAVYGVRRLRVHGIEAAPAEIRELAQRLGRRMGIAGEPRLSLSDRVSSPAVIGWLRPLILLPAACAQLSPGELEAVLAHELAHIRRRDYPCNLLQSVAEALVFFHPAAWWISHRIRQEREHCCDDAAIVTCNSPLSYAKALARLEERRVGLEPRFQLGADGGQLGARIRRILSREPQPGSILRVALSGGFIAALTLFCLLFASQIAVRQTPAYAAADSSALSTWNEPVPKKEPDLACTYYDPRVIGHDGICDVQHIANGRYTCIRLDDKKQSQRQIGCEWKSQRWLAWKQAQERLR